MIRIATEASSKLESSTEVIGPIAILRLTGDLSHATTDAFGSACRRVMGLAGVRHLIVEMSGIRMLDCGALGSLVVLQGQAEKENIMVSLCNPSATVYGILYKAHFHKRFAITPAISVAA